MAFLVAPLACNRGADRPTIPSSAPDLGLKSASFSGTIPNKYSSCDSQANLSPELSWQAPPSGTQSFALIVTDPDAPLGINFVHWCFYNLPPGKRELAEDTPQQQQLADGSLQGQNGFDKTGYGGPCPPGHSAHRYVFDLYALDTKLTLPAGASKKQVVQAMSGHILAKWELIGRYQR